MRLTITTPLEMIIDEDGVRSVEAEDRSGGFGILPSHAPFLTSLSICVVVWRDRTGRERYCAVRRGVLSVTVARNVEIATREAVIGDDLGRLEGDVLAHFEAVIEQQRTEHTEGARLQLAAIRQMMRFLRPDGRAGSQP